MNDTFRSSSPCTSRTGDFQVSTLDKRRGVERDSRELRIVQPVVVGQERVDAFVPVVDAVHVHAGREHVGRTRESHRGEIAAVRAAPQADARRVDVRPILHEEARAHHVAEFAAAGRAVVERFAELHPVADAAAVVDGEHDVALAGQPLVHRVGIPVVIHVVPAEEHLTPRPAVKEDHRRPLVAGLQILRHEQLTVDRQAVGRREDRPVVARRAGPPGMSTAGSDSATSRPG